jgi:hypothetical protein
MNIVKIMCQKYVARFVANKIVGIGNQYGLLLTSSSKLAK